MTGREAVVAGVASPAGRSVVRWAAAEAHARDAELRLVTARPGPDSRRAESAALLGTLAAEVITSWPRGTVTTTLAAGRPGPVLRTAAADAALLAVGADDASPFMEAISGSVPGDLAATAPCPVVVVPRRETTTRATAPVVLALVESRAAVAYGFAAASRSRRPLIVLRCESLAEPAGVAPMLAEFARRYPELEVTATGTDVDPRVALAAASRAAALLVLGSSGRGRLAPGLFGSVSRDLIRCSACPVVIARARQPKAVRSG